MKRKNLLLLPALSLLLTCCWDKPNNSPVVISGKWCRGKAAQVALYRLENGNLKEVATSEVSDADSAFYLACKPQREGFYFIGTGRQAANRYAFYLRPGDAALNFSVTEDSYELSGSNSPENRALEQWHSFVQPLEWKSVYFTKAASTYVDFFPLLEEKLKALEDFPQNPTGNSTFNRAFEEYKKLNLLDVAVSFLFVPRTAHPEGEDFPDYYRSLDIAALTQTTALLSCIPSGVEVIERAIFAKLQARGEKTGNPMNAILGSLAEVSCDTLKGEVVAHFASTQKTYEGLVDYEEKYGSYLVTDDQKDRVKGIKSALNVVKENAPAVDFAFPDAAGKTVALSDFKGKLVYIDVWAMWCGPCKKELPHLKKLEEEFHGNSGVVFLSVATDPSRDEQKWRNYVESNGMKGVQLFAGDRARKDIIEPYKIAGIPRFILVGRDGRLISVDAPRPSSPEIRPLIRASLNRR
ncbi:MAG: TlpA family protein disulfide reductase [Prevotellaceae bacterium]|jgi:thiol-disulfide isomerase/thioredoxin|nr:TlpA family protein disulfide reductase [Prevotellaceae bacterium]